MASRKKAARTAPKRLAPEDLEALADKLYDVARVGAKELSAELTASIEGRIESRLDRLERAVKLQEEERRQLATHQGWPDDPRAMAPAERPPLGELRTASRIDNLVGGARPSLPMLQEITDVAFHTAEDLSEIADELHQQLDRLAGSDPAGEPGMKDSPSGGGVVGDLRHALERIRHQVARVREALPRVASL